jgi:predicted aspartyl protease
MPLSRTDISLSSLCCAVAVLLAAPAVNASEDTPAAHCRYTNFATFPIKFVDRTILLDGSINGNATTMLVDTGSDFTSLTRQATEKFGLKLLHSGISTMGVGGESESYQTRVDDIRFGKLHWQRATLSVIWDSDNFKEYDGLVGADILLARDMEISLANREIKYFEPKACDNTFLAYWDENASSVPMREISPADSRQMITVEINGQKLRAIIDSGATTSAIDLAAAARIGITPASPGVTKVGSVSGIGKHEITSWRAQFASFSIGDETTKNPRIRIEDLYGAAQKDSDTLATSEMLHDAPDMLLGADFLQAHHVLFAISQRRLYFSYVGGRVFDPGTEAPAPAAAKAD